MKGIFKKPTCFEKSFASCEKASQWSSKNTIKPEDLCKKVNKKFWFDCKDCNHSYEQSLSNASKNSICPYCNNKELCNIVSCYQCYKGRFVSHPAYYQLIEEDKQRAINTTISASGEDNRLTFICNLCPNTKTMAPNNMKYQKVICSCCDKNSKYLCIDSNCDKCFNKSFQHHHSNYAIQWNYYLNWPVTPDKVFRGDGNKYYFDCEDCGHQLYRNLNDITSKDRWCKYCTNQELCKDQNCNICLSKSFQNHPKSIFWSDDNKDEEGNFISPRQVFISSSHKYKFNCQNCDVPYEQCLYDITNANTWCPCVRNKTEKKLAEFLEEQGYKIKQQYKRSWCMNKRQLPYDIYLKGKKIIIELDGEQHFKDIQYFHSSYLENMKTDVYKMKCAIENDHRIIRLYQPWVFNDKNNWKQFLLQAIQNNEQVQYQDKDIYKEMNELFIQ